MSTFGTNYDHPKEPKKRKSNFLLNYKEDPYQLERGDLYPIVKHYMQKYGINIIISGTTKTGKKILREEFMQNSFPELYLLYYFQRRIEGKRQDHFDPKLTEHVRQALERAGYLSPDGRTIRNLKIGFSNDEGSDVRKFVDEMGEANKLIENVCKAYLGEKYAVFYQYFEQLNSMANYNLNTVRYHDWVKAKPAEFFKRGAVQEIKAIQRDLKEGEVVGYVFTNDIEDNKKGHFEVVIITKDKIIKPVNWVVENRDQITREDIPEMYTFELQQKQSLPILLDGFTFDTVRNPKGRLCPQAGKKECGTLGVVYLKELLKEEASSSDKKLSLSLTLYFKDENSKDQKFNFFLPSPSVLRYSQSGLYNEVVYHILMAVEKNVQFTYKDKRYTVLSLEGLLKESIANAQRLGDALTLSQNRKILSNLPAFREKWYEEYQKAMEMRDAMDFIGLNVYLEYKTKDHRDIAQKTPPVRDSDVERSPEDGGPVSKKPRT